MNPKIKNDSAVARIDLESWATLQATAEHFPAQRRREVLERLGYPADADAWRRLALAGHVALFAAIDAGDVQAVSRYGHALDDTKRRLDAENPAIETLGPRRGNIADEVDVPANAGRRPGEDDLPPTVRCGVSPIGRSSTAASVSRRPMVHPILPLQLYACLRAECVGAADDAVAMKRIHACYGLDPATDAAEARAWAKRFVDRDLFRQYRALFEHYREVLTRRCG